MAGWVGGWFVVMTCPQTELTGAIQRKYALAFLSATKKVAGDLAVYYIVCSKYVYMCSARSNTWLADKE